MHTRKIPLSDDVDLAVLARGTSGFSGADLANLVNEAALNAARYNGKTVRMVDFEFAKDKVLMGAERRSMIISEEEKRITAIHEAGHALLTVLLPHADPIHKVTIIPRGMALGLTQQLPVDEKHNYSREYLDDQIAILLGGRIAEEITMSGMTTGAGNDLERATELARQMVCEWGMSEAMGPLTFGKKEEQIFLGREIAQHQDYSEDTALQIDQEVKRFVTDELRARARDPAGAQGGPGADRPTRCSRARCSTPSRCGGSWRASRSTRRSPPRRPARPRGLRTRRRRGAGRRSGRRSCRRSRNRCRRNSRLVPGPGAGPRTATTRQLRESPQDIRPAAARRPRAPAR